MSRNKRRIVVLAVAAMSLGLAPAGADGHKTRWFWTERKAEVRLMNSYSDVRSADCLGFGPTKRRRGRVVYSHFSCGIRLDDGTGMQVTVEVLGRRKARVLYNHATDIIR